MAQCPKCGTSPAYVSLLNDVECSSETCESYSVRLYGAKAQDQESDVDDSESKRVKDNNYLWITHHYDFG